MKPDASKLRSTIDLFLTCRFPLSPKGGSREGLIREGHIFTMSNDKNINVGFVLYTIVCGMKKIQFCGYIISMQFLSQTTSKFICKLI